MKRFINSPLKVLGLLTILLGLLTAIFAAYVIVLGLIFIGVGIIVYFIDFLTLRFLTDKKTFWSSQYALTVCYIIFAFITYMKWQEHNYIVFPRDFKGQAGIIFGIEGYPKLPKTKFWRKTITMPANGMIITSTKVVDIPSIIHFVYTDGSNINYDQINWDPNFETDCIICDSKIKSWLFQLGKNQNSAVKDAMTLLCNAIASKKNISTYKSEFPSVITDNKGKYLSLQSRGLTSLPNGLSKLSIYKAILTDNDLQEIPQQIYEITTLEDLIFAVNPISEFPCDLSRLIRLKSVSFANTKIKEINCDLSRLDSLEHFDISRNDLPIFPERIKTIPNLLWLSVNDNQLTDISFIDQRLHKLETLYLYSNKITNLSLETKFLKNLQELLIFDNRIQVIPDNIQDLTSLEKLEIWGNPIKHISPNISKLRNLKSMRISDDYLTANDKQNLKRWLPNCQIEYQTEKEKKATPYDDGFLHR